MDPLVDADAVARYLAVDRSWVYANADLLQARRLGTGPKARLRFSLEVVDRVLSCSSGRGSGVEQTGMVDTDVTAQPSRRRTPAGSGGELLPIRGRRAA